MRKHRAERFLLPAALVLAWSCGQPVTDPSDASNDVEPDTSDSVFLFDPALSLPSRLDILWVVSAGRRMCDEQSTLAGRFADFRQRLNNDFPGIDVQAAVVSAHDLVDPAGNPIPAGTFMSRPMHKFLPGCYGRRPFPCSSDEDCKKGFGSAWRCLQEAPGLSNLNLSLNTSCRPDCAAGGDCCLDLQAAAICRGDQSCLSQVCTPGKRWADPIVCLAPTGSDGWCVPAGGVGDCPDALSSVLSGDSLIWFKCLATVGMIAADKQVAETGLAAATRALDPEGPHSGQNMQLLRPDAFLGVVLVSDGDDASVAEGFCDPSLPCDAGKCAPGTACMEDPWYTKLSGTKKELCCGSVARPCPRERRFLGEFNGESHHGAAYDLTVSDCASDADCESGWFCRLLKPEVTGAEDVVRKCRPFLAEHMEETQIASYQLPGGYPVYSLGAVQTYADRLKALKDDSTKVLVAVIAGDGVPGASESTALISPQCLASSRLTACQEYVAVRNSATTLCRNNPDAAGCEKLFETMRSCIRECYVLSKAGDEQGLDLNTYICSSPSHDQADFGARYIRIAEAFEGNGLTLNLCGAGGLKEMLDAVADHLALRMQRFCLPRTEHGAEKIAVSILTPNWYGGDNISELKLNDPSEQGYELTPGIGECCHLAPNGLCAAPDRAIYLHRILEPDERLQVEYLAH